MSQMNRRDFMVAAGAVVVAMSLPVLQPEALAAPTMPDKPVDVGELKSYDTDKITETFSKRPNYLYIVRRDGKLYACLSVCTHKYRPLTVQDNEFYCPTHKAEFSLDGKVTKGPAKESLPRYKISVDDKGHVIVDCSKQFAEKEWDNAESYITIKT